VVARYAKEHKQRTRRRIVESAGRRLKSSGVTGSGVATLMADAGLTNGAFYAHFASKDELVARVVTDQLDAQRDAVAGSGVEQMVRAYLSAEHRDHPADGCPSAALLGEIARSGDTVRQAYTEGLLGVADAVAARLDPHDPGGARVRVLAAFAGMAGTLQAARAITDRRLSDQLLAQGVDNALLQLRPRDAVAASDQGPGHSGDPADEPLVEGRTA
jgi:TetR/AcrR family transcriptional regulator, transcriptional repressor for nem operon